METLFAFLASLFASPRQSGPDFMSVIDQRFSSIDQRLDRIEQKLDEGFRSNR